MPLDPTPPTIVEDALPGSAGEALNAYAVTLAAQWTTNANAATTAEGIFTLEIELPTWDELFVDLEAQRDALIAAGVDVTTDPLPTA